MLTRLIVRLGVLATVLGWATTLSASASEGPCHLDLEAGWLQLGESGPHLPVSLHCPRFTFAAGTVGGTGLPTHSTGQLDSEQPLELSYAPLPLAGSGWLEVKLQLQWSARESVLRKGASYRLHATREPVLLQEVLLEALDTEALGPKLLAEQPPNLDGIQSYPILLEGFFTGIEFPIASTRLEQQQVILAHRPGLRLQPEKWYETRKAVYGPAAPGQERQAFQRYISLNRPPPTGRQHFLYNPYWSTPISPSQPQLLSLMEVLGEKLYKPYGGAFDSCGLTLFTTDTKSIWKVDMNRFPRGLTELQEAAQSAGAHLDVFFSPSSAYPPALDPVWAKEQGYETIPIGASYWLCLAGPRYQSEAKRSLVDTVSRYKASHIFLDGYLSTCSETNHGHEPGLLAAEPIAEGLIDVMEAVRAAIPDIWLAATCFGANPSPWWAFWANSLIGTYGDDAPWGRVPCPEYRESYTTARDYYFLQGAYWQSTPLYVQDSFGITHQSNYPLLNDAVTEVGRGGMEHQCPMNPVYMTEVRWKQLAEVMAWARRNAQLLQNTEPLLPLSWQGGKCPQMVHDIAMPRAPYGYAHWNNKNGLVMLRNPWIEPQTYALGLPEQLPQGAKLSAVSLYPELRLYGNNLSPGDALRIQLAPYETVVLSIDERQSTKGLADAPQAVCKQININLLKKEVALVTLTAPGEALSKDATCLTADAATALRVELRAEVAVAAPDSKLLILVEDTDFPINPLCSLRINGKPAALSVGGSDTGWAATVLPKPERWVFTSADLPEGKNWVYLNLLARGATPKVSVWVWARKQGKSDGTKYPNALPQPEIISLDGACLLEPVSAATPGLASRIIPAPLERIEGVFLDALGPSKLALILGALSTNANAAAGPISIAGRSYLRGLGTIAPSRLGVVLDEGYSRFQAWVGLDSGMLPNYMDRSKASFEVWVDGQKRWESAVTRLVDPPEEPVWVDLDISGGQRLELVAVAHDVDGNLAQNWVDWADARLLK